MTGDKAQLENSIYKIQERGECTGWMNSPRDKQRMSQYSD